MLTVIVKLIGAFIVKLIGAFLLLIGILSVVHFPLLGLCQLASSFLLLMPKRSLMTMGISATTGAVVVVILQAFFIFGHACRDRKEPIVRESKRARYLGQLASREAERRSQAMAQNTRERDYYIQHEAEIERNIEDCIKWKDYRTAITHSGQYLKYSNTTIRTLHEKATALFEAHKTPGLRRPAKNSHELRIVHEELMDASLKNMLNWHVVTDKMGVLDDSYIRMTLNDLYLDAKNRRLFRHHDGFANHVNIYLYLSQEHFMSRNGQQIAHLNMHHRIHGNIPSITMHESRNQQNTHIASKYGLFASKYGLSEQERRFIYRMTTRAADRAYEESESKYPVKYPLEPGWNRDHALNEAMQWLHSEAQAVEQAEAQVAKMLGLTRQQHEEICLEGLTKNWPQSSWEPMHEEIAQEEALLRELAHFRRSAKGDAVPIPTASNKSIVVSQQRSRYEDLYRYGENSYRNPVGTKQSIELKNGITYTGVILRLDTNSVTIQYGHGTKAFDKHDLTESTRILCFRHEHAHSWAINVMREDGK